MNVIVRFWKASIIDSITYEISSNINVLKDMIIIRDGMKKCASLGVNDFNDIIDEICLNWTECILIFFNKSAFLCEIKILYINSGENWSYVYGFL